MTVGWTIQRLLRNFIAGKREISIISNATIGNAQNFLKRIKNNFEYNEVLKGLFREFIPKNLDKDAARWTMEEIELNGCSIETGSVEGNLVSRHYGVMINDDLVNKENSETAAQIAKVIDWWQLAQSLLNPDGIEITIGTRWAFDDLYGHIIEKFVQPPKDYYKGKPIAVVHNGVYHLLQMDCWGDPDAETGSTFPTLFPDDRLRRIFEEQGDRAYGQYRNDPLARGKNIIHAEWFRRYHPDAIPAQKYTLMLIDSAYTEKQSSAFTGIVMVSLCSDRKGYIRFGERKRLTDMQLCEYIVDKALVYFPEAIIVEDVKFETIKDLLEIIVGQRLRRRQIPAEYIDYIKSLPYILMQAKPAGRSKELRIANLAGRIEAGDFVFPMHGAEDLETELKRFPTYHVKDTADAFAYVLDFMYFPKQNEPVKTFIVPDRLKKTPEELEKEHWEELKEDVYLDGWDVNPDDDIF
ncbi:MAG: hypothetical protein JRI45_06610 [Deltaproteobacteria bacterium]|nr:hypothetical protein [Deltaproteobacteria bacterium]